MNELLGVSSHVHFFLSQQRLIHNPPTRRIIAVSRLLLTVKVELWTRRWPARLSWEPRSQRAPNIVFPRSLRMSFGKWTRSPLALDRTENFKRWNSTPMAMESCLTRNAMQSAAEIRGCCGVEVTRRFGVGCRSVGMAWWILLF